MMFETGSGRREIMANKTFSPSILLILMVVLLGSIFPSSGFSNSSLKAPDILERASGGGSAVEFERRSTFTFSAVKESDGSVIGTMVYKFRDFDLDFSVLMDIDCLTVEGNRARVSGLITRISANTPLPPFIGVGTRGVFEVVDNGNGGADSPDRYSDFHFFEATCSDVLTPYIPLDGNIVVKGS